MFNNDKEDQCQYPNECLKSCFTYCPHCHLFLCITHLKQHQNMMKNNITRMIDEGDHHRMLLEQQIDKIKQQQLLLNNLYEQEIQHLNNMHKFVLDICEKKLNDQNSLSSLMFEYDKNIKQFDIIKQEPEKISLITQIDQFLQQQNQIIDSKSIDEKLITLNISTIPDIDTTTDIYSQVPIRDDEKEDDFIDDPLMNTSLNQSSTDFYNETESESFSLKQKWLLNLSNPICPLSHANAFGLSTTHDIPGIPCDFLQSSKALTYGRCYYHLMSYHRLKPSVAKIIMEILSDNENKTIDFTTFKTFSKWPSKNILSRSKSLFLVHCPLTQENIYGLQSHHNVPLCTPRPPVHLYQHLRTFHCFKAKYALRLVSALINHEPQSKEIFQPNEHIINNSLRSKNRLKN